MGFLDRLLGRKARDPNVPEPADVPAIDTHDHPEGEEQAGGPLADHEHDHEHDHDH
jgi:hypothetical protein